MANVATLTYDLNSSNRESLSAAFDILGRDETPLYTMLPKTKVTNKVHSWTVRSLTTGTDNAQKEGAEYTFAAHTAPTLVSNYTQILNKLISVSNTQRAVNPAGYKDDFKQEVKQKMIELKTDIEETLITGTGNSGSGGGGTARRMKGFLAAVTTNNETGSGTGTQALTATLFNSALQTIWAAGGRPHDAIVNGFQKRQVSAFTVAQTTNVEVKNGRLPAVVSLFESDFGLIAFHLDAMMTTDAVLVIDKERAKVGVLRDLQFEETAKLGDSTNGVITFEGTLEYGNEAAHGKVTQLTTS